VPGRGDAEEPLGPCLDIEFIERFELHGSLVRVEGRGARVRPFYKGLL
jgi:hypothetical protein